MSMSAAIRPATLFIAGILGGGGIALAAAATHGGDTHFLGAASTMSLAHAPALLALYIGYDRIRTAPIAAILLGLGALIFAGDLINRHYGGGSLFPMAAPIGGMGMIAGWAAIALGAFFRTTATKA
ncbi:DUF423 domain-containing protein [Rhizobium sp. P40RR-XXII]|uniref:DUF423 domain-containing protein n=1 Tax=unclassified Rhizobium TaxID=2613769 RepID=UPI001456CF80|nr:MULTISPECIES: DUF423 domain-containing protein [unclassified Rhizobium]NLR83930.1 DUF423 domain-containing protein [Rhizobium sp. P28RR-XV]NLS15424.1 DUF423 domain-containing protein [Rhizobium sp. P40RR-XXII]